MDGKTVEIIDGMTVTKGGPLKITLEELRERIKTFRCLSGKAFTKGANEAMREREVKASGNDN